MQQYAEDLVLGHLLQLRGLHAELECLLLIHEMRHVS
jgi:hypothetical protein